MDLYEPATIHDAISPCVIAPCIDQAPPAACVLTDTNATLRGARSAKISPGLSNDSMVIRFSWPDSGRSLKNATGTSAAAELRLNHRGSSSLHAASVAA